MCANYIPVTSAERLRDFFGVIYDDAPEREAWPGATVPFIRLADPTDESAGRRVRFAHDGIFRFVPDFISTEAWAKNTYNARTETVHSAKTFRKAWADGQRCIIPAEAFYEYRYDPDGVRWRISNKSGDPIGIAGVYTSWTNKHGEIVYSLGMLTVNADDHPFMSQFHAPGEEKRMVVILDPRDFEGWLTCSVDEAKPMYCRQWHGPLVGEPAPLPTRAKKMVPRDPLVPPVLNLDADLFGPASTIVKPPAVPRGPAKKKPPPAPPTPDTTGDLFE